MKDEERKVFETHVRVDNKNALVLIFRAGNNVNVQSWSLEFEEMCHLCGWIDVQRVIYATFTRLAKLFVNYEMCFKSCKITKEMLSTEFAQKVDAHKVHKGLSHRIKDTETYQ